MRKNNIKNSKLDYIRYKQFNWYLSREGRKARPKMFQWCQSGRRTKERPRNL